jgi:hypothetical protein
MFLLCCIIIAPQRPLQRASSWKRDADEGLNEGGFVNWLYEATLMLKLRVPNS